MPRRLRTGGPLNWLNERFRLNSRNKSVPVMKLVQSHHPQSPRELEDLIEEHSLSRCACGCESKGTVKDFGHSLFEAQQRPEFLSRYPNDRFSEEDCYAFMFDLFAVSPIRGTEFEQRALESVKKAISNGHHQSCVRRATTEEDFNGLDLVLENTDYVPIFGIQVKPVSFLQSRPDAQAVMQKKLAALKFPSAYLYYNEKGDWVNMKEVLEKVGIA